MINGQSGTDVVHFNDSATSDATDLAFVEKTFGELFPAAQQPTRGGSPAASPYWVGLFTDIFGEDP